MSAHITIAGAGPTGLTLAVLAQASGHKVTIYDAAPLPDKRPRAVMVHARALEILTSVNLAKPFLEHGLMTPGIEFRREDGTCFMMDFTNLNTDYAGILNIHQPIIEEILLHAFMDLGGTLQRGISVSGMRQQSDQVDVDILDSSGTFKKIETEWLFGCDGARSTVRKLLGASFEGNTLPHEYILGEGTPELSQIPNHSCMLISQKGVMSWLPFVDGSVRLAGPGRHGQHALDIDYTPSGIHDEDIEAFQKEQALLIKDPRFQLGNIKRTASYRVHNRIASSWGNGRVWLAGDAAHVHPPAGGQALNLGLSDAESIAMRLLSDKAPSFDNYETERRSIAEATLNEVAMMPLIQRIRDAKSDTDFEEIHFELKQKAHRLSQIDTDYLAHGAARLGNPNDKQIRIGRRIDSHTSLNDAHTKKTGSVFGWRFTKKDGHYYWAHADRHIRHIMPIDQSPEIIASFNNENRVTQ